MESRMADLVAIKTGTMEGTVYVNTDHVIYVHAAIIGTGLNTRAAGDQTLIELTGGHTLPVQGSVGNVMSQLEPMPPA
jgi:hypothetical protein